ncbi:helix-turn-helix domain-containing protein [Stenotrophomonas sp. NRRL B-14846]|uniref:helix-turn-helix domain-containing protein n=1 Tax=Stenotrophomonas sp. NRRL B-14846 TaxID=3162882 RepID=UPI003D273B0D
MKSTRLHQARLLMLREAMTAEAASLAVGYASPSQFNREFKRLFALPPAAEVARMRRSFALPPAASGCAVRVFALSGRRGFPGVLDMPASGRHYQGI